MKKTLFVLFFCLTTIYFAQSTMLPKGTATLGGTVSYNKTSYENSKSNSSTFIFSPQAGYFFIDNFYAGIRFDYSTFSGPNNSSTDIFGFGPNVRYFFNFEKLMPFIGVGYSYSKETSKFNFPTFTVNPLDTNLINFPLLEEQSNYDLIPRGNYFPLSSPERTRTSHTINFEIGADYFITNYLALEALFNYGIVSYENENSGISPTLVDGNILNLNEGYNRFTVSFGLNYYVK